MRLCAVIRYDDAVEVVSYKIAAAAHQAVAKALRRGDLVRQPCEVCGAEKTVAHHDDYSKPLDVRWLCRSDHRHWHNANPGQQIVDWPTATSELERATVYLPPELAETLRVTADIEYRSLSAEIVYRLIRSVEDEL
jgi:hypothetical protein